jgi:uncharacterized PurR-regulated membrane protein YhhQ (DUF165 family)
MTLRHRTLLGIGVIAAAAYIAVIVLGNYAIHRWGVVPVWPAGWLGSGGYSAPAAVYFIGAALVLRDAIQVAVATATRSRAVGRLTMLIALLIGLVLSYALADPGVAAASAAAFACSESIDFALFTWIAPRWGRAVLVGGAAAAVLDTYVFLSIAPQLVPHVSNYNFVTGQLIGKGYGVAIATVIALILGHLGWRRELDVVWRERVLEHALA